MAASRRRVTKRPQTRVIVGSYGYLSNHFNWASMLSRAPLSEDCQRALSRDELCADSRTNLLI
jgi:hypothetical protein